MAIRKCGRVKISCTYRERENDYRCVFSVNGKKQGVEYVGVPRSLSHAVDSPQAYSDAAKAAISFAVNDGKLDESDLEWGDSGPRLMRPKRR